MSPTRTNENFVSIQVCHYLPISIPGISALSCVTYLNEDLKLGPNEIENNKTTPM
jgi:hypothetical protein